MLCLTQGYGTGARAGIRPGAGAGANKGYGAKPNGNSPVSRVEKHYCFSVGSFIYTMLCLTQGYGAGAGANKGYGAQPNGN